MIRTHRRINLGQAFKFFDKAWASAEELQAFGAYGSQRSIHRAMRRMLEHEAAIIREGKPRRYRITEAGFNLLGMVPTRHGVVEIILDATREDIER